MESLAKPITCGAMTRFAILAVKSMMATVWARIDAGTRFCMSANVGPNAAYDNGMKIHSILIATAAEVVRYAAMEGTVATSITAATNQGTERASCRASFPRTTM